LKSNKINLLITGGAGNLGGLLAKHLMKHQQINLHLMIHKKDVDTELKTDNVKIFKADLTRKETLSPVLEDIDVVVHFAGILFKHHPESFLPTTNIEYFKNLLDTAIENKVKRVILISFPHVEGNTYPDSPARGSLDKEPISVHAKTRLEEEKYLFSKQKEFSFETVSLRVGMVYGKGILMIDGGLWFARHWMLGIWKKPTSIHLISTIDFLNATENAIIKNGINGIYHIGDEGVQTLQEFISEVTNYLGYKKAWEVPEGIIFFGAWCFEMFSMIFNTKSPLTRDFIKIGMVSYYGDTTRMRRELLPELTYKTFKDGLETFR
jgi:nucleoside-diphosphate-sugar epimerase